MKTPASIRRSQKTTKMLRDIETKIQSLNKQQMSPKMRTKVRELQRVHNDIKKSYTDYMNTQIKKDVDSMFHKVVKSMKRPRRV